MKIIFMGTPNFAVPSLEKLAISNKHEVKAVFTQRPKASGRGQKEKLSPIHETALKYNIPVYTPNKLRENDEIFQIINDIEADIIVVVAYGFIIPKEILEAKKLGCINLHPSDLPKYRGASPMQYTLLNGEKETAICVIQMDEGLDTGDIIFKQKIHLNEQINYAELHDLCSKEGAELIHFCLDHSSELIKNKQTNIGASYAHKLQKEDGHIKWDKSYNVILQSVRALNPWPGTYFYYKGEEYKILEASSVSIEGRFLPGQVASDDLIIACKDGFIQIEKIQKSGKKPMSKEEFLKGNKLEKDDFLE